jgi:hypothetical protein
MPNAFAAAIDPIYAMLGDPVTYTPLAGGTPIIKLAIHNLPGSTLLGDEVLATEHSLRYQIASFPAVKQGDEFAIAGVDYIVTEAPLSLLDGAEHVAVLSKKP